MCVSDTLLTHPLPTCPKPKGQFSLKSCVQTAISLFCFKIFNFINSSSIRILSNSCDIACICMGDMGRSVFNVINCTLVSVYNTFSNGYTINYGHPRIAIKVPIHLRQLTADEHIDHRLAALLDIHPRDTRGDTQVRFSEGFEQP